MRKLTGLLLVVALLVLPVAPVWGSSVTDSIYRLPQPGVPFTQPGVPFTDISTLKDGKVVWHWAASEVLAAYSAGLIKGYPDGTFRPEASITVQEFTAIAIRFLGLEKSLDPAATLPAGYKADAWAVPAVAKAAALGLLGRADTTKPITRELAASILGKSLGLQPNSDPLPFKDTASIQSSYRGMVGAMVKAKLMVGFTDNTFRPGNLLTRAQAAVLFVRALNYGK